MSIPTELQPPRSERYSVQLLDVRDNLLRDLTEFAGGSWEINSFADIHGGGSVDLIFTDAAAFDAINWGSDRLRVWFTANDRLEDQSAVRWPLGVFLIEAPEQTYQDDNGTITCSVNIMDKLAVPSQDSTPESFSLPEGTNVVNTVVDILRGLGESRITVTESSEVLPRGQVWDPGTSWLEVINDLLGMINYNSLWCDGYGTYQVEPYTSNTKESPRLTFATGQTSLHLPEWSKTQNWFDVPNRYILVSQGDDENPSMVSVMTNVDGNNNYPKRYSVQERGRIISAVQTGVEVASQEALDAWAVRALMSASQRVTNMGVAHAHMPLWINDVVEFITPAYRGRAWVSKMSVDLSPGALIEATWREMERID